ncbi:MAG TPA: Fic family protein [Herpetosiphonaceae bacterium]
MTDPPRYLSQQDLLDLHGYLVERFGGRLGLASHDRLVNLAAAPGQTMFGQELYDDLPAKAAALAFYLIKNRPFRSANEATALLAVLRFAALNGHGIDDPQALAAELKALACSERDHDQLAGWLGAHLRAAGPGHV